jgi:hypothetical protein
MGDKWEGFWKEAAMAYLRYCPAIFLEGMWRTTEYLSQDRLRFEQLRFSQIRV